MKVLRCAVFAWFFLVPGACDYIVAGPFSTRADCDHRREQWQPKDLNRQNPALWCWYGEQR